MATLRESAVEILKSIKPGANQINLTSASTYQNIEQSRPFSIPSINQKFINIEIKPLSLPKIQIKVCALDVCYSLAIYVENELSKNGQTAIVKGKFLHKGKSLLGYKMLCEYGITENDTLTFVGTIESKSWSENEVQEKQIVKDENSSNDPFLGNLHQLLQSRFPNDTEIVYEQVLNVLNKYW